jgi:hypothetical protein
MQQITLLCHTANQTVPREPKEKKTDGHPYWCIKNGEKAKPVTDPRYIPLYTSANDLLLSATGIHFDKILFIAGIATPWRRTKLTEHIWQERLALKQPILPDKINHISNE